MHFLTSLAIQFMWLYVPGFSSSSMVAKPAASTVGHPLKVPLWNR